jgi:hypothetical protein
MRHCKHCGERLPDADGRCRRCGYQHEAVDGVPIVEAREVVAPASVTPPPRAPRYPQHTSAIGGAAASVTLGSLGLLVGLLSPLALVGLVLGALGIPLGLWGLLSRRRRWAVAGIVVCLLAMVLSGVRGIAQVDHFIRQSSPADSTVDQVAPQR